MSPIPGSHFSQYNGNMTQGKSLTLQQARKIQKQIEQDQAQPIKPTEKRIKIDNPNGFDDTIKIVSRQKKDLK